jgi:hypothetical protein
MHIGLNQRFGIIGEVKREVPPPAPSALLHWVDYSPQYAPTAGATASIARLVVRGSAAVPPDP